MIIIKINSRIPFKKLKVFFKLKIFFVNPVGPKFSKKPLSIN